MHQALQRSEMLQQLGERMHQSSARLLAIRDRLPPSLRAQVQPGPIEDQVWCLLVPNSAAAAKLRQLLPSLLEQLATTDLAVRVIRVKVLRDATSDPARQGVA